MASLRRAGDRVLIVDDDERFVELVTEMIASPNKWRIERAGTKAEALGRVGGGRFDLIIVDHALPDGSGIEVVTEARKVSPETPILFLTGHGSETVAMEALSLGATDYMVKDANVLQELGGRLQMLLLRSADVAISAHVVQVDGRHAAETARSGRSEGGAGARTAANAANAVPSPLAEAAVARTVRGEVRGAALFDMSGSPIASRVPDFVDIKRLGATAFQIHGQVGIAGRLTATTPRAYTFVLRADEAVFAFTTTGTGYLAMVCMAPTATDDSARRALRDFVDSFTATAP